MVLHEECLWRRDNRKDTTELGCIKLANELRNEIFKADNQNLMKDSEIKARVELLLYVLYGQNKKPIKTVAKALSEALPNYSSVKPILSEILEKVS